MLFVLDANCLLHAQYHIKKKKMKVDRLSREDLYDVSEQFLTRLEKLRTVFSAKYPDGSFVAVFDNPQETFRHMIYPKYKGERDREEDMPEVIASTFEAVNNDSDWIPIEAPLLLESDDLIASLAAQYYGQVIIHSSDKDMRQCLVDGRVTIIKKSFIEDRTWQLKFEFFSIKDLRSVYGFEPERWVDYQSIVGDSSDNLGDLSWKWAGDKLAKTIVQSGDRIESLSVDDDRLDKRQKNTLHEFQKNYPLMRTLVTLRTDIRWPYELEHLKALELVR